MKRKHRLLGCILLLQLLLSYHVFAQPIKPTGKVSTTPSDCQANGKITIQIKLHTGAVYYALIAPSAQLRNITADSVFENLPPGNYTVAIYDDVTGTDVNNPNTTPTIISNVVITSTYQPMSMQSLSQGMSSDNTADCKRNKGSLNVRFAGGKAPFSCTLASTQKPDSVVCIGTVIAVGWAQFDSLAADDYIVTIADSCGNTITGAASVAIDNNLGNFVFNTGSSYVGGIYSYMHVLHCDTLTIDAVCYYFGIPNNGAWVAGTNAVTGKPEQMIGSAFEVRFEYPEGSGNYTSWYKTDGSNKVKIPGYNPIDPKVLHVQIRNPCTGLTVDLPSVDIPLLDFSITATQTGDVCHAAPSFIVQTTLPYYWNTMVPGMIFPVTIDVTEKGEASLGNKYVWDSANSLVSGGIYYFEGNALQYGKTYDLTITTACGGIWHKSLTVPAAPPPIFLLHDNGTCSLDTVTVFPSWNTAINATDLPVRATIISGPGTMTGMTRQISNVPATNYDFGFTGPYGKYKIRFDFLDNSGAVCYSETDSITAIQVYKYYQTDTVITDKGSSCGLYDLELQGYIMFTDSTRSYGPNFIGYLYDSLGRLVAGAGTVNNNRLQLSDIPAGDYKWIIYQSAYCIGHATFDTVPIHLPVYQLPMIDLSQSGGVICPGADTGTLRVYATGTSLPITYSVAGRKDSLGIFPGLPAGDYTVQVQDGCGNTTAQTLTLFTATALQQLKLTGINEDSSVCIGSLFSIATAPVGAIDSIVWMLPNSEILSGKSTAYTIPGFSQNDTGSYKTVIYAAGCTIAAETKPIHAAMPPAFTTKPVSLCAGNGLLPDSTVYTSDSGHYTMTWFADVKHLYALTPVIQAASDTVLYFSITSEQGCPRDSSIAVRVSSLPLVDTVITNAHCSTPGLITLTVQSSASPFTFSIDNGFNFISDSFFVVPEGSYMIVVKDANGCLSHDSLPVQIINDCVLSDLNIPNIITPNGDGYNDTWRITGLRSTDLLEVKIINRWGNVVYENKHYDNGWSGAGLNEGTYYYLLTLYVTDNKQYSFKGTILIVR